MRAVQSHSLVLKLFGRFLAFTGAVFPRGLARRQGDLPRQPRLPLPVLQRARTLRGEFMLLLGKAGPETFLPVSR